MILVVKHPSCRSRPSPAILFCAKPSPGCSVCDVMVMMTLTARGSDGGKRTKKKCGFKGLTQHGLLCEPRTMGENNASCAMYVIHMCFDTCHNEQIRLKTSKCHWCIGALHIDMGSFQINSPAPNSQCEFPFPLLLPHKKIPAIIPPKT